MRQAEFFGYRRRPPKGLRLQGGATDARWYLLGFALLVAGIVLHQPLFVVLGMLLLLVLSITDIWAKYCLHDLHYQRSFSEQRVLFGEEITLSLTIENAKLLPLPWLEIEDLTPHALKIKDQELRHAIHNSMRVLDCLFSPSWYERVTRRYAVQCNTRGVHTFGPTILRSGDVFGFTSQEMELSNRQFVLVYPLIMPLTRFGLPARHPFGDQRAQRRLLEDPSRVIGIRDYQYGDGLRRVHWKATARTLHMQSKVYEPTTTYTLVIFLNLESRLDMHYGIYPELQELSICAAASVTNWAIDNSYAVGFYANTIMYLPDEEISTHTKQGEEQDLETALTAQLRRRRISIPISSSGEQRQHILEALARIQGFFGSNIEDIIQTERSRLPAGATIVFVTSTLSEQMIDKLLQLRRGGHAVTILFVGETPAPAKLAGLTIYHIGGEATWRALTASYNQPAHKINEDAIQPGFQL